MMLMSILRTLMHRASPRGRGRWPFLLLIGWPIINVSAPGAETWTLTRALDTALANSPDARIARLRTEAARALVQQADSAWYPRLTLQGGYTETNSPMMAFGAILNQRAFNFGLDFNHPGRIDNLNATGTLAYNLYSGGRATAAGKAARAGAEAANQDFNAARHQLAAEVVKAWFAIVKAREATTALEAGEKAYEAAVANACLRYEAGQLLKADLLNLEVELARTREQLLQARHSARLAGQALLYVLGVESDASDVTIADQDPALAQLREPATNDYTRRPELLGLQERVRVAESMVTATRAGRRPTVNAFTSYQYDRGWQLDRHGDSWMAGIAVSLNVFDGGETAGRVRQAAAELAQVKEMQRKALLGVALEAEQARLAFETARARLAVSRDAVAQAEESAALSRARFERGALLTADLIAVEGRLTEARMRRTFAAADERIALVEWRRAVGLPPLAQP
jgi:outer membrane protein